jgi:AcrR family transcriptional regulator
MDHREQRKQELRRTILDAAKELVVRDGYEAFSMRKLAQGLGYSPGNLYVHFQDKGTLLGLLVEESFARLHRALDKVASRADQADPVSLLKEGMQTYVKFGLDHPGDYRIAFLLAAPDDRRAYATHPAFEVLRDAVARCKKARRLRAVDTELASQALWSAIHGVTSLLIQRPAFPWVRRDALIGQVIDSAVDSLAIPSPKSIGRNSK